MVKVVGKNNSLRKLRKYCRLVGFFPYHLVQVGDKVEVKYSLKYLVWSFFIGSTLSTVGTVLSLIYTNGWFPACYINEMMVVYIVHMNFMFNILSGVICITYTTFSRRSLNEFINNFIKVDIILGQLKIPVLKNRWSKPMAILVVMLIIVIILADSASHFLVLDYYSFLMHVLRKVPYFSSYFFTVGQTYMFWSIVLLIRARLRAIKDALMITFEDWKLEKKILVQEFKGILLQLNNTGKKQLKSIQEAYICLFDAAKAIDELVRPFIVLSFVIRFFTLLIAPFMMYVQILGYKSNFFIFSQTCWAIGQVSLLALIIEPASSCRQEYEQLRKEISILLCYEKICNEDLNLLFDLIKGLPIEFHINDATPLRRLLYVSILGNLTTYLVVLFQMKLTMD